MVLIVTAPIAAVIASRYRGERKNRQRNFLSHKTSISSNLNIKLNGKSITPSSADESQEIS
jgi:hypothetical protein